VEGSGTLDLAGLQTLGADKYPSHLTALAHPDTLKVYLKAAVGDLVGVGDFVPFLRSFAANLANSSH